MIRAILLIGAAVTAAALHYSRAVVLDLARPGVEQLPFADDLAHMGEATRRRSLGYEDRVFLARTVFGECARCSREEQIAIINVVINRYRTGRYGHDIGDVVLYSRGRTFAFSTWSPLAASNFHEATGTHVTRHPLYGQILGLINEVWQSRDDPAADPTAGALCYYHPAAMKPAGRIPPWAIGRPARWIGSGVFVRCKA